MTEKRFTDDGIEEIENQSFTDNLTEKTYWIDNGLDEIVKLLNNFNDENKQLKQQVSEQGTQIDFLKDENAHMRSVLNENKQLKQRNTNQYNQLNELWEIIEEETWEKLIAMKKQLKENEEQLQKEWKCYE